MWLRIAGGALVVAVALSLASCAGSPAGRRARSTASGATESASAWPGTPDFERGLVDNPLVDKSSDSMRSFWLARAHRLGSTSVRIEADWSDIAPTHPSPGFQPTNPADPQYNWTSLDAIVRSLAAHDQTPVILVLLAPGWAEASGGPASYEADGVWLPDARKLGQFAQALATRYSGNFPDPANPGQVLPRVTYFQAWNEPNLPTYLMPEWQLINGTWVLVGADIYRGMLNAFYAGVHNSHVSGDVVLSAGTAPYGGPPANGAGSVAPAAFLREMFCLDDRLQAKGCSNPSGQFDGSSPPHFDVLDHHPYSMSPTVPAHNADDISVPDMGKIWTILHAAQRDGRALPAGPKQLWDTEIDWSTDPPDSESIQARYLSLTFYVLWKQGVSRVFWFDLVDHPYDVHPFNATGLYRTDGTARPSAAAYHFPFVGLNAGGGQVTLWGEAPGGGPVTIQSLVGGRWRIIQTLTASAAGAFYAQKPLGSQLTLRAVSHGLASPSWATG